MARTIYLKPKERHCPFCGTEFVKKNGRDVCPKCGTEVVGISRITGYVSFDERFNEAKVHERNDRVDHSGGKQKNYV